MVAKSLVRLHWAKWASSYDWDICGTLNFATGCKVGVDEAQRRWAQFWGKLDRICYGQSRGHQQRISRFVYTHCGSNGDNVHSHFMARSAGDTKEFCILLNALWAGLEHAGAAVTAQNEILPIFSKQRASWYLLHEDHDGAMSGFNAKLTHTEHQPKVRDTALIDLRSAADRFQHIADATTAYEEHLARAEQRYIRRNAK
ncbi:hypothetical protein MCEREM21A_02879 [Sphingomonadaceae bacterium]